MSTPTTWTLAIDTSTVVCAALSGGERVVSGRVDDTRAHAEQLQPLVDRLCAEAGIRLDQVGAVAVGVGPGPFTGLRVGVVTGLVVAALAGVTPRGVCSLDVVARQYATSDSPPEDEFVAALDARRKELYWSRHATDGTRLAGPFVTAPAELPELPVTGPGALVHPGPVRVVGPTSLDAGILARDAALLPDAGTEPLYLRTPDAQIPTARKSTLVSHKLVGRR